MGKIAYLDLDSGISGDMFLGALIDLGGDAKLLEEIIQEFNFENVHVVIEEENRGIEGKNVKIKHSDQPHRELSEVIEMIEGSDLSGWVKEKSLETFRLIGEVESEIHGIELNNLELHEVGMVDSILDVVGSIALAHDLKIEKFYCSSIFVGSGHVECEHGKIPVPVPATEKLLEGMKINFTEKEGELVTPTGAALLNTLAEQLKPTDMRLKDVGVGYGDTKREEPNALRMFLGEKKNLEERIEVFTFYIDDLSPEKLSHGLDKIREKALDVYSVPVTGKKGRQGWEIKALGKKSEFEEIKEAILKETSTLGFRIEETKRIVEDRKIESVKTEFGEAKVKVSKEKAYPEYESCKKIAEENEVPLEEVYKIVKEAYKKEK